MASERLERTVKYYKRHGFIKTLKKTYRVLFTPTWTFEGVSEQELERERIITFEYNPKFSVLIPMYKTPIEFFKELLDDFQGQTYTNWELCLADGSGEDTEAYFELLERQKTDSRIKYKRLTSNDGISGNTNQALDMATGDYIVLCDHDDRVTPDAFFRVVEALNNNREIDTLYTDEDKLDMEKNKFFDPAFKPDFNIDYFRAGNYICHMFVTRREIAEKVRFLSEYDGAQDFDFIFRCTENSKVVHHIPRILYHWRCHMNSTAMNPESKTYAYEAGEKAVKDHLKRVGISADVHRDLKHPGYVNVYYTTDERPKITIVTAKDIDKSVIDNISYDNFDVVYAEEYTPIALNKVLNQITGEYVLFLDSRIKKIDSNVVLDLVAPLINRDDLNASFARVYALDDTLYSCGAILGIHKAFGMMYVGTDREVEGQGLKLRVPQNMMASDISCAMFKAELLQIIEGFDESLNTSFAGVDLFMQFYDKNHKMSISLPYVVGEINHKSGLKYDHEVCDDLSQKKIFAEKWSEYIKTGDPTFNRNLDTRRPDFFPRRMSDLIEKGVFNN